MAVHAVRRRVSIQVTNSHYPSFLIMPCSSHANQSIIYTGLPRVREKSGKNKIFSRSGNCQGILKKCQGIFVHLTNVRELSGNFVMTINFFLKMISLLLLGHFFKS